MSTTQRRRRHTTSPARYLIDEIPTACCLELAAGFRFFRHQERDVGALDDNAPGRRPAADANWTYREHGCRFVRRGPDELPLKGVLGEVGPRGSCHAGASLTLPHRDIGPKGFAGALASAERGSTTRIGRWHRAGPGMFCYPWRRRWYRFTRNAAGRSCRWVERGLGCRTWWPDRA